MYQLDCENVLLELPMDSNLMKNCLHAVERHNRMLLPLFILWNLVWESELVNQQFVLLVLASTQSQEWISSLCFSTGSFAKGLLFTMSVSCALALIVPVTHVWRLFILLWCRMSSMSAWSWWRHWVMCTPSSGLGTANVILDLSSSALQPWTRGFWRCAKGL